VRATVSASGDSPRFRLPLFDPQAARERGELTASPWWRHVGLGGRDRCSARSHGRRCGRRERVENDCPSSRPGSPPCGRPHAARGLPFTSIRDRQWGRGTRSPRRPTGRPRSGDSWRCRELGPGPRARSAFPASRWKEALSRPARVAPAGSLSGAPTARAGVRDHRRARSAIGRISLRRAAHVCEGRTGRHSRRRRRRLAARRLSPGSADDS
jgi:hypothetical protein